jgi:hypothetical protein
MAIIFGKIKIGIMEEFENFEEKMRYEQAVKRVKKIKGFYTHAVAYILEVILTFL